MNGRAGSFGANPVMNCAAKLNTPLKSSGVSKGFGKGACPSSARMYEEWRDSTVKMEPAAVRYASLAMAAAAPRYADTPTPSRTEASWTKDLASVDGKE